MKCNKIIRIILIYIMIASLLSGCSSELRGLNIVFDTNHISKAAFIKSEDLGLNIYEKICISNKNENSIKNCSYNYANFIDSYRCTNNIRELEKFSSKRDVDKYIPCSLRKDHSKVENMDTATIKAILKDNDAKTVAIIISTGSGKSQGSGFFIKPGVVVTNFHVINNGSDGQVRTIDGKVYEIDGVISASSMVDVAVLKLKNQIGESVKFGDPSKLEKADPVMAIGSPLGLYNTVTVGMYVNRWEGDNGVVTLQCSLPLAPGNSGGPLFNIKGEVVGINTAIAKGYGDIAFARSIEHIRDISHKLTKLDFGNMRCTKLAQIDWNGND
ncbi:MAG: trypsin-like peptidase domain-containing protein [Bacillota bacterium]|nr:trypsin-like peptidase domain-containing protein [Bacillota bacterium]